MITETDAVAAALSQTRPLFPRDLKDSTLLAQLVVRGAQATLVAATLRETDGARREALRRRLAERLRTGEALDRDAAHAVRQTGWSRFARE